MGGVVSLIVMPDTRVLLEEAQNRAIALISAIDTRTDDHVVHVPDLPHVRHTVLDVLTLALYALAITDDRPVSEVGLDALALAVHNRQQWRFKVQEVLMAAGHDFADPERMSVTDPIVARWARLHRIGADGHNELDLWLVDAASVVDQVLAAEHRAGETSANPNTPWEEGGQREEVRAAKVLDRDAGDDSSGPVRARRGLAAATRLAGYPGDIEHERPGRGSSSCDVLRDLFRRRIRPRAEYQAVVEGIDDEQVARIALDVPRQAAVYIEGQRGIRAEATDDPIEDAPNPVLHPVSRTVLLRILLHGGRKRPRRAGLRGRFAW